MSLPQRASRLPWPLLVAGGLVGFVLVVSLASAIQPFLGVAAVVVWVLLAVALLYHAGFLPFVSQVRLAHALVSFVLGPAATGGVAASAGRAAEPKDDPEARARLRAEAEKELASVLGQPIALDAVRRYLAIAEQAAARGRRNFGADRAAILLLHGPPGTGKSFVAKRLIALLYAQGAIAIRKTIELARPVGTMAMANVEKEWQPRIEQALDGVLLVDNADWLAQKAELSDRTLQSQLLALVDAVSDRSPRRLCVVLTAVSAGPEVDRPEWLETEESRRLLERHSVFSIPFEPLADADLVALFAGHLEQRGLRLAEGAAGRAERALRRQRQDRGDRFDNAEAARRLAEQVSLQLAERRGDTVTEADLQLD